MRETDPFFDTNVLLYLLSNDTAKANRAEALLAAGGVISVQVLNEFASVASRKLRMSWVEIIDVLKTLQAVCHVEPLDLQTHELALKIAERYGFSVYDAMILAAAQRAGCRMVFSEDLQDGQLIKPQLTVVNPFVA